MMCWHVLPSPMSLIVPVCWQDHCLHFLSAAGEGSTFAHRRHLQEICRLESFPPAAILPAFYFFFPTSDKPILN